MESARRSLKERALARNANLEGWSRAHRGMIRRPCQECGPKYFVRGSKYMFFLDLLACPWGKFDSGTNKNHPGADFAQGRGCRMEDAWARKKPG